MNKSEIVGTSLGCFNSLTLEKSYELYLKLSDDFNLNAVELRFEKEIGKPSLWSWEVNTNVIDFLQNFENTGVHLPFIYLNPISPNPKIRNESISQLKDSISKASKLEMNYAVMHARGFAEGLTYEQQIKEWKEVIIELAKHAEDNSILLTIENADVLSNLRNLVNIVKDVNSKWLKITLDVGHAHIRNVPLLSSYPVKELMLRGGDIFLPFFIKRNMPYEEYGSLKNFIRSEHNMISNLHIHDYNGRQDHITIGKGKIDFSFLVELKMKNFKGPYIFESIFKNHYLDFDTNYRIFADLMNI